MNQNLLVDFQKELTQIRKYIEHINQVNNLLNIETFNEPVFQEFRTHFLSFTTDKKVFEYKAIVISLYGLLEKYIELWIQEYLRCVSQIVSYDKLSENMRNNHFELSMKLIGLIREDKYEKYSRLRKEDVLKKLNKCIENNQPYEFNVDAFTIQSGNLTPVRIENIFKTIDIVISKELTKHRNLVNLIGISLNQIQNTESSVLFGEITDLVERRNKIAHGAEIIDLLDSSALEHYIKFLEQYCCAIFEVLKEKFIENYTIEKYKNIDCESVFKNKSVIGISIENYEIKIGDWLIIKTGEQNNDHFYKKQIISLGKGNKNDYEKLEVKEKTNISIGIDNQESLLITKQCAFYLENR